MKIYGLRLKEAIKEKIKFAKAKLKHFKRFQIVFASVAVAILAPTVLIFAISSFVVFFQFLWLPTWGVNSPNSNLLEIWRVSAFISAGVVGAVFAWWRSSIADRQRRVSELALNVDRYQKGALMLDSEILSIRLAGVNTLGALAADGGTRNFFVVNDLLFSFVRERSKMRKIEERETFGKAREVVFVREMEPLPSDVKVALEIIQELQAVAPAGGIKDIHPDLSRSILDNAIIRSIAFYGVDLSEASCIDAKFSDVTFEDFLFDRAKFDKSEFDRCKFTNQTQSNKKRSYEKIPSFSGATFRNTIFERISARRLFSEKALDQRFANCSFKNCDLSRITIDRSVLFRCNFRETQIGTVTFTDNFDRKSVLDLTGTWCWADEIPSGLSEEEIQKITTIDRSENEDYEYRRRKALFGDFEMPTVKEP
ncbi:DNA primase [Stappia aggregata IAM 12614]|uniref:DNA primase n=1 Tax=Roseibium aggregatum (strain ATCC 25650 / DSM 13394 / JCM 20685 / NBRC 16684 / NCIMB 2208 / IAM 12614 / B1) TaxID=384765 RepID=A0NQ73_ROSAI|nr:pentapeptide repeat-containing protein [Roseibium aggregatum]EAV44931.1 DNA primase [Stappia aggregata IAM 12614] [Roseibium aggregatum IAM 12614]